MLNSAKIIQAVQMRYLRKNRGGGGGGGGGRVPLDPPLVTRELYLLLNVPWGWLSQDPIRLTFFQ